MSKKYTANDIVKFQETISWSIENAEQVNDTDTAKELKDLSKFLNSVMFWQKGLASE